MAHLGIVGPHRKYAGNDHHDQHSTRNGGYTCIFDVLWANTDLKFVARGTHGTYCLVCQHDSLD